MTTNPLSLAGPNVGLADSARDGKTLQEKMYEMSVDLWEVSRHKECTRYSEFSPALLDFCKQGKGSFATYMKWATTSIGTNEKQEMKDFRIWIVRNAFDAPLYATDEYFYREQARQRDETFLYCFDRWSEISGISAPTRQKFGLGGS